MLVTRRQIAKGAAWSLPLVAVGAAAPAASASTDPRPVVSIEQICKADPHNHGDGKPVHLTLWFGQSTFLVSVSVAGITTGMNKLLASGEQHTVVTEPIPNRMLSGTRTPVQVTYTASGGTHYAEDVTHGPIPDCAARP